MIVHTIEPFAIVPPMTVQPEQSVGQEATWELPKSTEPHEEHGPVMPIDCGWCIPMEHELDELAQQATGRQAALRVSPRAPTP